MHHRSRSRLFREGWNTALKAVARGLEKLPLGKAARVRQTLDAVGTMVGAMASPPPRLFQSNRVLAKRYGVNKRTITNWRRDGCPFDQNHRKVLAWIARRRYAPKGTEAKFKDQLSNRRIRNLLAETKAGFAQIRQVKALCKLYGIELEPWLKGFRCPKRPRTTK